MDVVALDGELDRPDVAPAPLLVERSMDDREGALAPEVPHPRRHPQRDVDGLGRAKVFAAPVGDRAPRPVGLPSRPLAAAAPPGKLEGLLPGGSHGRAWYCAGLTFRLLQIAAR
jgi:hypothetical protein